MSPELDLDDIQYLVLARAPAITGRYEFLSFRDAAAGRKWLAALLDKAPSVSDATRSPGTTGSVGTARSSIGQIGSPVTRSNT